MVRDVFIMGKVVGIYRGLNEISYPIRPETVLSCIPKKCRMLSYQELAEAAGCGVEEIVVANNSRTGATCFDREAGRYLILYNEDMNEGRIRWTKIHEIGHVLLGHLESDKSREGWRYSEYESEADFFTWNLLAPMPVIREMGVESAEEMCKTFGLSTKAGTIQFDRYERWRHHAPELGAIFAGDFHRRALRAEEEAMAAMERSILRSYHLKGRPRRGKWGPR